MRMHLAKVRLIVVAVMAMWLWGCQTPPGAPPAPSPPTGATPEQVQSIRESLRAADPQVQVGVVADVLPMENLAAIQEVEVSLFKAGDIVCFMDGTKAPLVCGQVVRVTDTQVHVKYETPPSDRRAPMKGDVAVAFR